MLPWSAACLLCICVILLQCQTLLIFSSTSPPVCSILLFGKHNMLKRAVFFFPNSHYNFSLMLYFNFLPSTCWWEVLFVRFVPLGPSLCHDLICTSSVSDISRSLFLVISTAQALLILWEKTSPKDLSITLNKNKIPFCETDCKFKAASFQFEQTNVSRRHEANVFSILSQAGLY